MAKTWAEITADQEFQGLPAADQDTVREAFWQRRVVPTLGDGADVEQARAYFDQRTRIRKQDLPEGATPSTAGAGRGDEIPGRGLPTLGERMQQGLADLGSPAAPAAPAGPRRGGMRAEFKPFVGGDERTVAPTQNNGALGLASMGGAQGDPMLRQTFVDKERQDYQSVPVEYRREALLENAKRNDVIGRAAREILRGMPQEDMRGQMAEGRSAVPLPQGKAGGSGKTPPGVVTFPDQRPTVPEMTDFTDSRAAVANREAGLQTSLQENSPEAMRDREYRVSGAMATEEARKQMAKDAPHLAAFASGIASGLGGAMNAPAVAADYLNQLVVNPIARNLGAEGFSRAPNMPGVEFFMKAADQYMPEQAKQGMSEAWDDGKFIPWLTTSMAAQAPQMAQSVVAAMVPPLRALILPTMGAQSAGQSYYQGDSSAAALSKGVIEAGSEMLPLKVFDKVKEAILKIPAGARSTVVAEAMKRLAATGAAVTASGLAGALEEGAAAVGQNLVDIHLQGQNKSAMDKVPDNMVIGAVMGKTMSLPHAASIMRGDHTAERQAAGAINQGADAYAKFFTPDPTATAPTAARADSLKRFDEAAAAWGLSPKAASAVREQAGTMPSDEVPGFLARATAALSKRGLFRRPVDEAGLADLDKRLRPPPNETETPDVNQPDVDRTAPELVGASDGGSDPAARSGGTVGSVPVEPGPVVPPAGAPAASGGQNQPVADGRGPDPALTSKRTPEDAIGRMAEQDAQDYKETRSRQIAADNAPTFEDRASDDILSDKGTAWASKTLANKRLRGLPNGYRLARVSTGWVIKPETSTDNAPFLDTSAERVQETQEGEQVAQATAAPQETADPVQQTPAGGPPVPTTKVSNEEQQDARQEPSAQQDGATQQVGPASAQAERIAQDDAQGQDGQSSVLTQDAAAPAQQAPEQSRAPEAAAPAAQDSAPDTPVSPAQPGGFDSAKFDADRNERIKASREAGNTHLDKVEPYVETMRGKRVYYVHDPKVKGTVRTVDNNGNVYVNWSDAYSAEKEGASPMRDGKKTVMQTSLGPRDLKDYVLDEQPAASQPKPETPTAPAAEASQPDRAAAAPAKPAKRPPKSFRTTHMVTTAVWVEESGSFEQREVDSETALKAIADDIKALQAFRACVEG